MTCSVISFFKYLCGQAGGKVPKSHHRQFTHKHMHMKTLIKTAALVVLTAASQLCLTAYGTTVETAR